MWDIGHLVNNGWLKCILRNWVWGCGLDSSGSRQWPVLGSNGHGNEPSGLIKSGKSLY
jgi:hypothetical protein